MKEQSNTYKSYFSNSFFAWFSPGVYSIRMKIEVKQLLINKEDKLIIIKNVFLKIKYWNDDLIKKDSRWSATFRE